jgi:multidrug efflux pump subunit AcrA (membrane-fusion protein)
LFRIPKPPPGWKQLAEALFITVLFVSVLLFVVYQLAVARVEPEVPELKEQVNFLGRELSAISERYKRVQARQTVLERETEILRKANLLLREEESQRQAELNQLQGELDFYRRLAGIGGEQTGLAVYEAELGATDSPRVFQFVLTLTQNIRRASIISGTLGIDVEGTLDHRPVTLDWSQLSDGEETRLSFRFKYFQQLVGYLTLPENFSPTRLIVTLEVTDQRKPVSRAFDWKYLLDAAATKAP